ncbi:arginase family protein, partial [bacterium]|nr:arginase family protein [bacterium]
AIGSALASRAYNGSIGVIWIDAHTDFHLLSTTMTGNLHGLPLAVITGQERGEGLCLGAQEFIDPGQAVVWGARSVDAPEWANIARAGVSVITMDEISREGAAATLARAWAIANADQSQRVHVSFDVDVIDPSLAPGVSVPAAGGIDEKQLQTVIDWLCQHRATDELASLDIVEYNPVRDVDGRTVELVKTMVAAVSEN